LSSDLHKIKQRLESLRERNEYDSIDKLDSYLSLNLENSGSHNHYIMLLRAYQIQDYNPDRNILELEEEDVMNILTEIENSRYKQKTDEYSTATKNKLRKALDYILRVQDLYWDEVTPRGLNIYQEESQELTKRKELVSPQDLNQFLDALGSTCKDKYVLRNEAFFYTLWNTGARVGAVRNIMLSDVEIKEHVVEVTVPAWKDSPERPELPLYFAAPVLKRYINSLPEDQDYLFKNREGNPIGYQGLRKVSRQAWKHLDENSEVDVKVDGQPMHIFRKSFKTYAGIMELLGPNDLDKWTGHALGSTQIKKIYDRRSTEDAGNKMRSALGLETQDEVNWKQKIAPQSCENCGQQNSSHRSMCFSCGGVLKPEELPGELDQRTAIDDMASMAEKTGGFTKSEIEDMVTRIVQNEVEK